MHKVIIWLAFLVSFSSSAFADGLQGSFWFYDVHDVERVRMLKELEGDAHKIVALERLSPLVSGTVAMKTGTTSKAIIENQGRKYIITYSNVRMEGDGSISFHLTIVEDMSPEDAEEVETTTITVKIESKKDKPKIASERRLELRTPFKKSAEVRKLALGDKKLYGASLAFFPGKMVHWSGLVVQVTGQPTKSDLPSDHRGVPWTDQELIAFYERAITIPDSRVRRAAIESLARRPEGYDIILQYLKDNVYTKDIYTITGTWGMQKMSEKRGKDIFALYRETKTSGKDKYAVASSTLLRLLLKKFPEQFKHHEYVACLETLREYPNFCPNIIERIEKLVLVMPKEQMYQFVPHLCNVMKGTHFFAQRKNIFRCLAEITGKKTEYRHDYSPEQLEEALKVYREHYDNELKHKIPELNRELLTSPFGNSGDDR